MSRKVLTKEIIAGFDSYKQHRLKYSSIDTSPISKYLMHPFWDWLVQFYPMWLAPNLITMTGFLLLVLSAVLLTFYDPHYTASDPNHPHPPIPPIVFLISSFCFFWAHQLDGTDGKQARRTASSTPLGELMDHGLDSWASVIMPYCLYSIFGRGEGHEPWRIWMVFLSVSIMFYLTHWEKYNTGVLYLPWGYDLSQLGMTLLFLVTYFIGTQAFQSSLPFPSLNIVHFFEFLLHGSVWLLGIPMCLYNIYLSYKEKTGNMLSAFDALSPLLPLLLHTCLTTTWALISPANVLVNHPRLFFLAYGSVYSNITCRCIVNCMSKTKCQYYNHFLTPLLLFVLLLSIIGDVGAYVEVLFLSFYFVATFAAHSLYAYHVVTELAGHFDIFVFKVKKPKKK